jgi:hypothetical protein
MMSEKLSHEEIRKLTALCPDRSMVWEHYKGGYYRVLGVAVNEADLTPMVVYRHEGSGCVFTRPLAHWEQEVEREINHATGRETSTKRFRPVGKIGPAAVGGW